MTSIEILEATKARLLRTGWVQGEFGLTENHPTCLSGALAGIYKREHMSKWHEARTALDGLVSPLHLIQWNDAPDRTIDEVVALLDKAIGLIQ